MPPKRKRTEEEEYDDDDDDDQSTGMMMRTLFPIILTFNLDMSKMMVPVIRLPLLKHN